MHDEICDDCGEYMESDGQEWWCIQSMGCERDIFAIEFALSTPQ